MEKSWLSLSEIKFVIISRGRSQTITSHRIFPYADLVVPESEVEQYKWCGLNIVPCGDEIKGLSLLRNWCLQRFKEEVVVMIDDDVERVVRIDNVSYSIIDDVDDIRLLVLNTAQCAKDLGTFVFGFGQTPDVRKYNASEPFSMNGWCGGVIGVIGKEHCFINNKFKVDIDFCLEALLEKRVIWKDNRIVFQQKRDRNIGGNSLFRNSQEVENEKALLKKKWGKYIEFKKTKNGDLCKINVKRKETYPDL